MPSEQHSPTPSRQSRWNVVRRYLRSAWVRLAAGVAALSTIVTIIGFGTNLFGRSENDSLRVEDIAAAVAAGETTTVRFEVDGVGMALTAGIRLGTNNVPVASSLRVRPKDRVQFVTTIQNVDSRTSPPMEILIRPEGSGLTYVEGSTRKFFGTFNGDFDRDLINGETSHWKSVGTYGRDSQGFVVIDLRVDDDYICGRTTRTVAVFARASNASASEEVRSDVRLTVERSC